MKENFKVTTGAGENKATIWEGEVDFSAIMSGLEPSTISSLALAQLKIKARAVALPVITENGDVAATIEKYDYNNPVRGKVFSETEKTIMALYTQKTGTKIKADQLAAQMDKYATDAEFAAKIDKYTAMFADL